MWHVGGKLIQLFQVASVSDPILLEFNVRKRRQPGIPPAVDLGYQQLHVFIQRFLRQNNVHCKGGVGACWATIDPARQAHALAANVHEVKRLAARPACQQGGVIKKCIWRTLQQLQQLLVQWRLNQETQHAVCPLPCATSRLFCADADKRVGILTEPAPWYVACWVTFDRIAISHHPHQSAVVQHHI